MVQQGEGQPNKRDHLSSVRRTTQGKEKSDPRIHLELVRRLFQMIKQMTEVF